MQKTSPHPQWALTHKRKGAELRRINGRYYLYEVSSRWCPQKKRAVKVTGRLLGRITEEEGFVESDKARLRKQTQLNERVQVKEYGLCAAVESVFGDTVDALKKHFPDEWQRVVSLACSRLMHQAPLKNMAWHHAGSCLSEMFPEVGLSPASISRFLRDFGGRRGKIVEFCRSFKNDDDCIIFDGTDMLSRSERMELPGLGKTKSGAYDEMLNLMCVFSVRRQEPVLYRLLPGCVKDVSAFKLSLEESGVDNAVVVVDKGFASARNIEALEKEGLKFVVPLHRNSRLVSYDKLKTGDKRCLDGYFKHEERHIWHCRLPVDKHKSIVLFLDEELRNREQKDYLNRIENGAADHTIESFHERQPQFGTIAMLTNTDKPPREVYADYKTRGDVEQMIDALKNILEADRTYMQNEQALEAWMFVNLIALKWYYTLLNLLKKHELNDKFSVKDLLMFLESVKKVKINGTWRIAEITKKSAAVLKKLGIVDIT